LHGEGRAELGHRAGTGGDVGLGDHELLNKLGKGGMGVVYRARQRSANRVALKVIWPDKLEDLSPAEREKWIERFRSEAQATARIEHDNVVPVYEVGEIDGQLFYSMRYIEGQSLAHVLQEGPIANRRAATYLEALSRGVHYAHSCGILHRDINPKSSSVATSPDRRR
jgi:serine/threonine-protein kinase